MMGARPRRRGFTLTDLCAVLAMACLFTAVAAPSLVARARERANRIYCAANLRTIGLALHDYADVASHRGSFPVGRHDPAKPPTAYTGWDAPDPSAPGGPDANDVTAALFLLWRTDDGGRFGRDAFTCPSGDARPWDFGGNTAGAYGVSNWPGREFLAYSYANPYLDGRALAGGLRPTKQRLGGPASPVVSDMNPGGQGPLAAVPNAPWAQSPANSRNHNFDGQNVLFGDNHVEFCGDPFAGEPGPGGVRDNIFTYQPAGGAPAGINGPPTAANDAVLLPTDQDGPAPTPREPTFLEGPGCYAVVGAVVLAAGAVGATVVIVRARRRTRLPPPLPPYGGQGPPGQSPAGPAVA